MDAQIEGAKRTHELAKEQHGSPDCTVMMFSGGGDSMAAYQTARALDIKIDVFLHIRTGTGIPETTEFVRQFAAQEGVNYVEADSGDAYERRVLSKGFLGRGTGGKFSAHSMAFHLLKRTAYESALAKISNRRRGFKFFLLNGARASESKNRSKNIASSPVRLTKRKPGHVWVNLINDWNKSDCQAMCDGCPKNPVSVQLCRSGECMCGTTQSLQEREEAAFLYPEWGAWLDDLEERVKEKFPWGWGEAIPKSWTLEKKGQMRLFDDNFQPLCSSCNARAASAKTVIGDGE